MNSTIPGMDAWVSAMQNLFQTQPNPQGVFDWPTQMSSQWMSGLAQALPTSLFAQLNSNSLSALQPFVQSMSNALQSLVSTAASPAVQGLQAEYLREVAELVSAFTNPPPVQSNPGSGLPLQLQVSEAAAQAMDKLIDGDKRFAGKDWHDHGFYEMNAAMYALNARFTQRVVELVQADDKTKAKLKYAVSQMVDAMSPANFFVTNPEAQKKLLETKGESLSGAIANIVGDLQKGRISMTDEAAFEVGKNVATTPGDVVFECDLFQLIQYKPTTEKVGARPMLFVPPCINKFYILDLQPDNSLVAYLVSQGHTLFLVSWRNPTEELAHITWDDYIEDGVLKAIDTVRAISKQDTINLLGFCVGGTLVSTALAVLASRGEHPVASLTLLTTFLDFTDTGTLGVFVDEEQVKAREQSIGQGGIMSGKDLSGAFSSLRPNDLVWNYVVSNYLKGEKPPAFDLLYWNADSTNLPGPMFAWYLRNTYLENNLCKPGKVSVCGEPVDFSLIDVPVYILATREDHIVPWGSAYQTSQLVSGPSRFVLGASGHIAGVINPASKNKRSFWVNANQPDSAQAWFESATEHKGSWWSDWAQWLEPFKGKEAKAPAKPGNARYKPIEPAPGSFVKYRVV